MKTRGFVSAGFLIAIVLGLVVLGGGAYYVMQTQSPSPTLTENNLDTLPTTQSQTNTSNPAPTQTNTNINPTASQNGWKSVASAGLTIEYPPTIKISSNTNTPVVHLEFKESDDNDLARVFISGANIIPASQDLKSWLEGQNYFAAQYRAQKYTSYKRKDGVEVFASFGNASSYDDAFMRAGTAVVYVKNGVNENTKASDSDFREIIERIKLPSSLKLGAVAGGYSCITGADELMTLYWGTQYRKANPSVPFIYAPGSYCESADGSKLMTMAYFLQGAGNGNEQAIVSFDSSGKISNSYKGNICHTIGDFDAPRILSVEQGNLNLFCLSGDAGEVAFNVYRAPLTTLVPTEAKRDTNVYNTVKAAVEKLYGRDF